MFNQSLFTQRTKNNHTFEESEVIFVNDFFSDEYGGGAELSTESLYSTSERKVFKLKSSEVDENFIGKGLQKLWVFFNFSQLNFKYLPTIAQNLRYFIVEYDYKFCKFRSIEKHKYETGANCDCHLQLYGKNMSAFFNMSDCIFWMSQKQKEIYEENFPFLSEKEASIVLSSVFTVENFELFETLRNERKENGHNNKWAVINSNSWIKGVQESVTIIKESYPDEVELLGGLSHSEMLKRLSKFKGLSFHPLGGDTCPRIVIEAKMLGLELSINEHVQHANEDWFSNDVNTCEEYLLDCHNRFWNQIENYANRDITLSGYTHTHNVINHDYPWRESIMSMLNFCDEVIVLDGGSSDGTWEELQTMSKLQGEGRLIVKQFKRNWDDPRFAIYDGQQKTIARTLCTKEWCWQMDVDEIVHEDDYKKIKPLLRQIPKSVKMISLPVIEYWGSEKIRIDVNPWKNRLSKNDPHIIHDIHDEHRRYDEDGFVFSLGSDGCDYVNIDNYRSFPDMNFYNEYVHKTRVNALSGDENLIKEYRNIIETVVEQLPGVHHYSWFDLKRKIFTYKNYWSKHWTSLFKRTVEDTIENNMFFDKKWSDVTDSDVTELALRLENEMGGWIFHKKIDFDSPTPWISIDRKHPEIMTSWVNKRGQV